MLKLWHGGRHVLVSIGVLQVLAVKCFWKVNGAIRERNAKRSHQSPFATCDSDESNGASGPCRVDMTNSNGCPALEDAKDAKAAKGSAGSVEDSDLFDRTQLIQLGRMDERAAPAPIRSKHFPNSQMSQPETAKTSS